MIQSVPILHCLTVALPLAIVMFTTTAQPVENVTIGVCDTCGNRYYSADILHTVHVVATGAKAPERIEHIPVTHLGLA